MIWFKDEVMPLILKQLPQTRLTIVGSNPTPAVTALADRTTRVAGFISDQELEHTYTSSRVAIAPLRFGAGMKGKVAEALRFGVPVVTTPVGAQGLEGAAAAMSIASSAKSFADHVVALLCSDDLWRSHSIAAQEFAREHLSSACLRRIFELDVHR
jgi:glycosyltransferase involved in cell wall biosynthesis